MCSLGLNGDTMEEKEKQIRGIANENEIVSNIGAKIAKEASILLELNKRHPIGDIWKNSNESTLVLDVGSGYFTGSSDGYSARAEISGSAGNLRIIVIESGKTESRLVLEIENTEMKTFEPGDWMSYFAMHAEEIIEGKKLFDEAIREPDNRTLEFIRQAEEIIQGSERLNEEISQYFSQYFRHLNASKRN